MKNNIKRLKVIQKYILQDEKC